MQGDFTWSKIMDQNIYLNAQDPLSSPFRYQDPSPNLVGNLVGIYQFPSLSGKRTLERYTLGDGRSMAYVAHRMATWLQLLEPLVLQEGMSRHFPVRVWEMRLMDGISIPAIGTRPELW
jgi:hypothetical protein